MTYADVKKLRPRSRSADPKTEEKGRGGAHALTQMPSLRKAAARGSCDACNALGAQGDGVPLFLGGRGPIAQRKCETCQKGEAERTFPLFLRARMKVSHPSEPLEKEADHVAEAVTRGGAWRVGGATKAPSGGVVQAKLDLSPDLPATAPSAALPTSSAGEPLAPQVRARVEPALGADLGGVRVHTDAAAGETAKLLHAKAITYGSHIYLGPRESPNNVTLLAHEATHVVQQTGGALEGVVQRSPEQPESAAGAGLTLPLNFMMGGLLPGLPLEGNQPSSVVTLSEAEYEAMTGQPASSLPEAPLPTPFAASGSQSAASGSQSAASGISPSIIPVSIGMGSLFMPKPNWVYRVLSSTDPVLSEILGGADLLPRSPDPGFTFQPAANPADMTFRHLRAGGPVPQLGTDRISTARSLEAFETVLANRGTGELVRVDIDAARRLGAEFLENPDIMGHLDEIEREILKDLEAAQKEGRGKNHLKRLNGRLEALRKARAFAETFAEGQGVNRIPSRAITEVKGASLGEAVAAEQARLGRIQAFRYAGRVLLVVGAAMSVRRVATALPEEQARVAAQEVGGWAFSLAGASLGAKAGAGAGGLMGIESGPGAFLTAALGSLIGAALGFFGGEEAADELYDVGEGVADGFRLLSDTPRFIETSTLMFGSPEDIRSYYEWREIETGEPPPWDGL